MHTQCNACARGPSKVDGHADLRVRRLGPSGIILECRSCGLLWSRSYRGADSFTWTRLDRLAQSAGAGVAVPAAATV